MRLARISEIAASAASYRAWLCSLGNAHQSSDKRTRDAMLNPSNGASHSPSENDTSQGITSSDMCNRVLLRDMTARGKAPKPAPLVVAHHDVQSRAPNARGREPTSLSLTTGSRPARPLRTAAQWVDTRNQATGALAKKIFYPSTTPAPEGVGVKTFQSATGALPAHGAS